MTHTTDLYFEVHVTFDPVASASQEARVLAALAEVWKFRVDAFATTRGTSYLDVRERTERFILAARASGFVVRRYKLEDTLVDSKGHGDPWGLLT